MSGDIRVGPFSAAYPAPAAGAAGSPGAPAPGDAARFAAGLCASPAPAWTSPPASGADRFRGVARRDALAPLLPVASRLVAGASPGVALAAADLGVAAWDPAPACAAVATAATPPEVARVRPPAPGRIPFMARP